MVVQRNPKRASVHTAANANGAPQRNGAASVPFAPTLNCIAGAWRPAERGACFENRNPADKNDVIGHYARSGPADVSAAVAAAESALPAWRNVPPPQKGALLRRCAEVLASQKEPLARLIAREMGKPIAEARGDVQEAIDCANLYAGQSRRMAGETLPSELPNKMALTLRRPIGVCGLITPWNFPVAVPSWKIFPALLCGNTLVFKPAEDSPASGAAFVRILHEAGLPPGVLNLVQGIGEEAGAALLDHPAVALISFTGSSEVGALIAGHCGASLKRCALELGGKNAQIVMPDADLDLAQNGALWGAFATAGQRCTATSRLLLHRKIAKAFTKRLVEATRALRLGDPLDERTQVGPLIRDEQRERVYGYVRLGVDEGARLLCGGKPAAGRGLLRGNFFEPTLLAGVKPAMRVAQEEIFGPVLSIIEFNDFDEAIAIANGTVYGLSSCIYTSDVGLAFRAMHEIEAGITYINGPTIGAEVHLPFGGVKRTGNGHREAGETALDIFSEWKTVYVDYSGRLQRAQMDVQA